jgi:N-methylhydantoinase A/oxoprolinase/acetone carboxylase beta subunit
VLAIGCDVGGTHTDAVLLEGRAFRGSAKLATTDDVTTGILAALRELIAATGVRPERVTAVMVGTTHFTNAVVQRQGLAPVACIRMGAPGTEAIPPLTDWPPDLARAVGKQHAIVHGGYEFDGREHSPVDQAELRALAADLRRMGIRHAAVVAVFAPLRSTCEEAATAILLEELPELSVTLSHDLGQLGLLERENAAVLNAALKPLAERTINAIRQALVELGLRAPLYLTQNDGTLMSADYAERFPVLTFASGPANSMRGAAYLSGLRDAIVVDVGGTTSDFGALVGGFPREAGIAVTIGGVRTNFRMPDLLSLGLGGGSVITDNGRQVGPRSVGHRLVEEGLIFGGSTLTASDIAVAAGRAAFGQPDRVRGLEPAVVRTALGTIDAVLADAVDHLKLTPEPLPLVAVGGGSVLLPGSLPGVSEIVRPPQADVANAIGAAIAQASGEVEQVHAIQSQTRAEAIARTTDEARRRAVAAGATAASLEVVDIQEIPLAYMQDGATRVRVRVVGEPGLGR